MRNAFYYFFYFLIFPLLTGFIDPIYAEISHYDRLQFLKSQGFEPLVIYDLGAHKGDWSRLINNLFPHSLFFLFEANPNQEIYLKNSGFPYFISLIGDKEEKVIFYSNDSTGDSIYREQTFHYYDENCNKNFLQMTTLRNLVATNNIPLPDLIKLDVQGAEKLIIEGSPEIISNAEALIIETKILEYNKGAPLIFEIMSMMYELGFTMIDIFETHYLPTGELNEIDLFFAKNGSKLIKKDILIKK